MEPKAVKGEKTTESIAIVADRRCCCSPPFDRNERTSGSDNGHVDNLPAVETLNDLQRLHKRVVMHCVQCLFPNEADHRRRFEAFEQLKVVVKQLPVSGRSRHPQVDYFGSFGTGLYLPSSDIDVQLYEANECNQAPFQALLVEQLKKHGFEVKLPDHMTSPPWPRISLRHVRTTVAIDLNFGRKFTNAKSMEIIKRYIHEFPPLKFLVLLLKDFYRRSKLPPPFNGGIGSYALTLFVINFLLYVKRCFGLRRNDFPEMNLGLLLSWLIEFIVYRFNYLKVAALIPKHDHERLYASKRDLGQTYGDSLLFVVDPACTNNNAGETAYRYEEFRRKIQEKWGHFVLASMEPSSSVLQIQRSRLSALTEPSTSSTQLVSSSNKETNDRSPVTTVASVPMNVSPLTAPPSMCSSTYDVSQPPPTHCFPIFPPTTLPPPIATTSYNRNRVAGGGNQTNLPSSMYAGVDDNYRPQSVPPYAGNPRAVSNNKTNSCSNIYRGGERSLGSSWSNFYSRSNQQMSSIDLVSASPAADSDSTMQLLGFHPPTANTRHLEQSRARFVPNGAVSPQHTVVTAAPWVYNSVRSSPPTSYKRRQGTDGHRGGGSRGAGRGGMRKETAMRTEEKQANQVVTSSSTSPMFFNDRTGDNGYRNRNQWRGRNYSPSSKQQYYQNKSKSFYRKSNFDRNETSYNHGDSVERKSG